jgi:accessory gene regulator B
MIETLALKMAEGIKRNIPDHKASVAVLKYSLAIMLNTAFIIIGTLLVSFVTSRTKEVIILLIVFASIRQISGGIHLKSGMKCVLATTTTFTILSLIHLELQYIQILNVVSIILYIVYAPSRIRQQNRIPRRYYPGLKILSVLIVSSSFFFQSTTLTLCFLVQGLTLITWREVK